MRRREGHAGLTRTIANGKSHRQVVFEQIDYVVDCKNQRIVPDPEETEGMLLFDDF